MTAILLVQLGIKGALILLAAWSLTALMRRASAASRHLVWAVAIAITLAMPLVRVVGPSWNVVIPVETTAQIEKPIQPPLAPATQVQVSAPLDRPRLAESTPAQPAPLGIWALGFGLWDFAIALWAMVAALLLFRLAYGMWRTHAIATSATPVTDDAWLMAYDEAAAALCVTSPVQLRQTAATRVPVACGIIRPAILLPMEADSWSRERRLVVLLHELAHVRRRDCLVQTLARVTSALHWVNPLAHFAVARLRAEQEHACDDLVLTAGTAAPVYADHLFDIARSFRAPGVPEWATLAMARPSQLEGRLTAILNGDCNREPLARRLRIAVGIAAVVAIVGLGALQVSAAYVSVPSAADASLKPAWLVPAPKRQASLPAPPQAPRPSPAPTPVAPQAPQAPQAQRVAQPPNPPRPMVTLPVPPQPAGPGPQVNEEVRRRVADALATALGDENEDVRRHALTGLTQMRDQRAVPALMKALRDPSPALRRSALSALAQFNAPEAYDAMVSALRDENADVRRHAVVAVGRSGRPQAVEALIPMLKDPVAEVRQEAAVALARIAQGPRKGSISMDDLKIDVKKIESQAREMEKTFEASFGKDWERQVEQWGERLGDSLGHLIEGSMNGVFGGK